MFPLIFVEPARRNAFLKRSNSIGIQQTDIGKVSSSWCHNQNHFNSKKASPAVSHWPSTTRLPTYQFMVGTTVHRTVDLNYIYSANPKCGMPSNSHWPRPFNPLPRRPQPRPPVPYFSSHRLFPISQTGLLTIQLNVMWKADTDDSQWNYDIAHTTRTHRSPFWEAHNGIIQLSHHPPHTKIKYKFNNLKGIEIFTLRTLYHLHFICMFYYIRKLSQSPKTQTLIWVSAGNQPFCVN